MAERLGIGFVGSGFNARFHILSLTSVREIDVRGVYSPNEKNAASTAALARELDVGEARPYKSIRDMVADPAIDALWLCGPNHARIDNITEIVDAIKSGAGTLRGLACEKPLARNVAEARKVVDMVKSVGLNTSYLENQLYSPDITRGKELIWARGASLTGRPYLARAAEEHSGPHMPWFWQGNMQGGGVLNDMMCHSVEVVRHLLTKPGSPRSSIKPVRISGHIASLKWSRPHYAKLLSETMGKDVDYTKRPSEDFARATIEYESEEGETLVGEVTTSWSFVGAGLRLSAELLGPEYSMSWNTLDTSLKMFFSREVRGKAGEDLVEKQNAEMGLMPVVAEEASVYGYSAENRQSARAFLKGEKPMLTFDDGLEVVKILMTAYMSAQTGRTLEFPPKDLDSFVPAVAQGKWNPRAR
ncbi:MAG TPA: Gfo/Idh/MocA family oxidoreductase [Gemmatimonadaceae bacterium]|jgi:predicted dehydrogenase|nr:Gfo/Idh/MocA family oxidoreductase [Gemmatimonadaceae bacterium]